MVEGSSLNWRAAEIDTLARVSDRDVADAEGLVRELSRDGLAPLIIEADASED